MSKTPTDIANNIDSIDLSTLGAIDGRDVMGEVERLADSYGKHADLLLVSVQVMNSAKSNLEHLEAQLDLQVRKSAELSGEKLTEKKVKSAVESTNAHASARSALDLAEGAVERCKMALKTLDKKERMLDLLARFQIREYGVNARTQ